MSAWTIRLAERRDVPDLLSIEVAQFPEPWTRSMLLDEITNLETRRYTVAVEDKKIVGYLGVMYVMDELHVNTIGTLPGHESRGIATALMNEAWTVAKERGVQRATLEVAVSNTRAQELYFRFGFSPVGVRKNYYERTKEDALILWAELA
ncbi:MAG TPA: ribosomal protein S18-alanine N-acetyltransferase [Acidimicrobiales bacterium]|jgi:ribosomal-protein-alanine N-acetyltransferase|nr:ribosomal protein S18-alanine N-acetyltransferase [Acidimicrobiales bacterium]